MEDDDTEERIIKVRVENIFKIFGPNPKKIVGLLKENRSKHEIFEKTRHVVALNDISFEVFEGETFVLMGLSGCGKSTLLRCLNRLIKPTSGRIYLDDTDIADANEDTLNNIRRHKMGMIFQGFALLPHYNVLENVAFGLEIQGIETEERHSKAIEALELVGLSGHEESMPSELSGGMKQRVGLARALASSPEVLLMDEAFSALDPLIRRDMQDELIDLQDRLNKTIIFVTHDLDEALKLGDRIALMKDGEIVQVGTPEEILTQPENAYVEKFVEDVDMVKVLCARDVMKRPEPLVPITAGPNFALRMMKEWGISSVFITKSHRLRGIVMVDDAVKALKSNTPLEQIIITDIPTVMPDTPLSEIIPLIADSTYPIAVVNNEEKIKGIIVRGSVLAAIGRTEGELT